VFLTLCYVALRRVLQLAALRFRSNDLKELEMVLLRHELAILRRRTRRPAMTWTDRLFLTAASRLLPRVRWLSFMITPATLPRWHRRLVAKRDRSHAVSRASGEWCGGAVYAEAGPRRFRGSVQQIHPVSFATNVHQAGAHARLARIIGIGSQSAAIHTSST
jgi:hypothetical protein